MAKADRHRRAAPSNPVSGDLGKTHQGAEHVSLGDGLNRVGKFGDDPAAIADLAWPELRWMKVSGSGRSPSGYSAGCSAWRR